MNANEGLMRIAKVVQWIGTGLACLLGLLAVVFVFMPDRSGRIEFFVVVALAAVACYGTARGLSWIIEGFAKPK